MLLKLDGLNVIVELHGTQLAPRHQSQLAHWGFRYDSMTERFEVVAECPQGILQKLTEYFAKHGLSFECESGVRDLLDSQASARALLKGVLAKGASLKEGHFDKPLAREFLRFLRYNVKRRLKNHQVKAAIHLLSVQNGANFSVPGSGKTTVVLVVFHWLRSLGVVDSLFVVGPPSCFWPWRSEYCTVLGSEPTCEILAGGDRSNRRSKYYVTKETVQDLYLTTFPTFQRDCENIRNMLLKRNVRFFLVVDEAHYFKQIDGAWASAVLRVAPHAMRRCILTGTPFPKSYMDAFNLFDFLWPGCSPLSDRTKHEIQSLADQKRDQDAADKLHVSIGPLFYRVRKRELGLSAQRMHVVPTPMMSCEKRVYDSILDRIRALSKSDYFRDIDLLLRLRRGRMIRLRQSVSYVKLLQTAVRGYHEELPSANPTLADTIIHYDALEEPGKLRALLSLVQHLRHQDEKVVVWSCFIETLKLIRATLAKNGHGVRLIYGATPTEKGATSEDVTREKIIRDFVSNESGVDVLVANPAACAESISLHKTCCNAVYYDLSYNCAQYIQSMDRIHRVGGSEQREAHYYFLQYADTMDEDILANVRSKADRMAAIIDRDYAIYSLDMFSEDEELEAYDRLFGRSL